MFDGIYFEFPLAFILLFIFIACAFFCKMRLPSIYFPHVGQFLKGTVASSKILFFLKWLGVVMMIVALMSPIKDEPYELEPKDGLEIALILDTSGSMRAQGFDKDNQQLNRFDVVKEIVSDFIQERKNDNMGLVVFGSYAFIASPPTYDVDILKKILSQLEIAMAGEYTALNTSLAQGVNLLKMSKSKSKIAILLTDGYSTPQIDAIPMDIAIDMAKKEGVKVYPIGIGMPHEYNIDALLQIANESGGVAFGASSAAELQEVYNKIDKLETSKIKRESFTNRSYYYQFPLFLALISLMLYLYLRNRGGYA